MSVLRKIVEYVLSHFVGQSNLVVDTKLKHPKFLNGHMDSCFLSALLAEITITWLMNI